MNDVHRLLEHHEIYTDRLARMNDLGPLSFRGVEFNEEAEWPNHVTVRFIFARGSVIYEHGGYRVVKDTP